jgi:hypothetical protein
VLGVLWSDIGFDLVRLGYVQFIAVGGCFFYQWAILGFVP